MEILNGWKTYIGIAITVLATLSQWLGWDIGDLAGLEEEVIALIGAAIAIYGRFVTKA